MKLLHKDDIDTLDLIINTCIEKKTANHSNLPDLINEDLLNMNIDKKTYYSRFFAIIKDSGIADVGPIGNNQNFFVNPLITTTQRFIDAGGFKNLYAEQQEKIRIENILQDKELNEAKVIKWTKKTYWLSVVIVALSFIISVIALIVAIVKP